MTHPEFLSGCKSVTVVANGLILVELDGGQHFLFYNFPLLVINSTKVWEAFCDQFVPWC